MTTAKREPRRSRPTRPRPINFTVSSQPCRSCDGRGFLEKKPGFAITEGMACPICRGTGRRC